MGHTAFHFKKVFAEGQWAMNAGLILFFTGVIVLRVVNKFPVVECK
jgi:hypothetical protein